MNGLPKMQEITKETVRTELEKKAAVPVFFMNLN